MWCHGYTDIYSFMGYLRRYRQGASWVMDSGSIPGKVQLYSQWRSAMESTEPNDYWVLFPKSNISTQYSLSWLFNDAVTIETIERSMIGWLMNVEQLIKSKNWQGKPKCTEETCFTATLSTINPTWHDLRYSTSLVQRVRIRKFIPPFPHMSSGSGAQKCYLLFIFGPTQFAGRQSE
jgi:hypothetical protein